MGSRTLIFAVVFGVTSAGFVAWLKEGHMETVVTLWKKYVGKKGSDYPMDRFQIDLCDRINYARMAEKFEPIRVDMELDGFLKKYETDQEFADLNRVTRQVQEALPRYANVVAWAASSPSMEGLLDQFHQLAQKSDSGMTNMACAVRETAGGLGNACLVVLGQRLPDFSPELLTKGQHEAFYSVCHVCGHKHICKVSNKQRSMTLECPSCKKNYAVIAADSQGRFRYVNEFLTGYYPPARFPKELSRLQVLFTIWSAVHSNCLYTQDPGSKQKQTDAWQTAVETQNMQKGDCEDSAIFLADWLLARGFQARVALGRYGDMGGHAWCVVRLEEKDYLLESTESQPDPENPPLAALIGSRYVPEVLFDRHAIYVRNLRSFDGNYWSDKTWTRLEPRRDDPVFLKTASKTAGGFFPKLNGPQQAVLNGMSPDRLAVTKEPSPAYAPFVDIETIPSGSDYWQVPVPDLWAK